MNEERNMLTLVFKYEELGTEFLNEIQNICEKYNIDLNNNSISQTPKVIPLQQGPNIELAMLEVMNDIEEDLRSESCKLFNDNFDYIINKTSSVVDNIIPICISHIFEDKLREKYGNKIFLDNEDDDYSEDNEEFRDHIISIAKKLAHDNN